MEEILAGNRKCISNVTEDWDPFKEDNNDDTYKPNGLDPVSISKLTVVNLEWEKLHRQLEAEA